MCYKEAASPAKAATPRDNASYWLAAEIDRIAVLPPLPNEDTKHRMEAYVSTRTGSHRKLGRQLRDIAERGSEEPQTFLYKRFAFSAAYVQCCA